VADAEHPPGQRPEPTGQRDLEALARQPADRVRVHPGRGPDGRDRHRARRRLGAEEVQRAAARPFAQRRVHGAGEPAVARLHRGQALFEQQLERRLEAEHQRQRRRAAELLVRQRAGAAPPVPVEARRRVRARERQRRRADRHEAQPRRQHQPFLRGADDEVDALGVHRQRRRRHRGHRVHHQQRRVAGGVDGAAHGIDVARHAAGGVGVHQEDGCDAPLAVGAQRVLHRLRVHRPPLGPGRAQHRAAQRLALQRPGLGEVPGAGHEGRGVGRQQVLDHRLPGAVTVGGVEEQLGAGLQQVL